MSLHQTSCNFDFLLCWSDSQHEMILTVPVPRLLPTECNIYVACYLLLLFICCQLAAGEGGQLSQTSFHSARCLLLSQESTQDSQSLLQVHGMRTSPVHLCLRHAWMKQELSILSSPNLRSRQIDSWVHVLWLNMAGATTVYVYVLYWWC